MDHEGRGLKSQMKRADKLGARVVAIMGDDELAGGHWAVRDMAGSRQDVVPAAEVEEHIERLLAGGPEGTETKVHV